MQMLPGMANHDTTLVNTLNGVVNVDDDVWHLGDFMSARAGECEARRRRARGGQLGGEIEGSRMSHLEGRREVERCELSLDGLGDLPAAVSGVAAPQTSGPTASERKK